MTRREAVRIARAAIAGYKQALKEQAASDLAAEGLSWEDGATVDQQLNVLKGLELFVSGSWSWLKGICELDEQGRDKP